MRDPIKVKRDDIALIVRATFPDYKGRKFRIDVSEAITLFDLNWSGGSRSQYRTCTLAGVGIGTADKYNAMAPWDARQVEGASVPIPPGAVMVRHSMFCGKDMGLTVYVNPADMPKVLNHQDATP